MHCNSRDVHPRGEIRVMSSATCIRPRRNTAALGAVLTELGAPSTTVPVLPPLLGVLPRVRAESRRLSAQAFDPRPSKMCSSKALGDGLRSPMYYSRPVPRRLSEQAFGPRSSTVVFSKALGASLWPTIPEGRFLQGSRSKPSALYLLRYIPRKLSEQAFDPRSSRVCSPKALGTSLLSSIFGVLPLEGSRSKPSIL